MKCCYATIRNASLHEFAKRICFMAAKPPLHVGDSRRFMKNRDTAQAGGGTHLRMQVLCVCKCVLHSRHLPAKSSDDRHLSKYLTSRCNSDTIYTEYKKRFTDAVAYECLWNLVQQFGMSGGKYIDTAQRSPKAITEGFEPPKVHKRKRGN